MIRYLKIILTKFWNLHSSLVSKNIAYKNKHVDQICLILGNGSSLKLFDTGLLDGYIKIGCSYSLVDKRLQKSGLEYCIYSDTYLLYKFLKHSYSGRIVLNRISPILKDIISENPNTIFFTSITNFYAFLRSPKNLRYFYNFGVKNVGSVDLAANFSADKGALDIMLGIAKYMGFSEIYILGCDYLGSPKFEGHFYDSKIPKIGEDDLAYQKRFKEICNGMNITLVVPEGVSSDAFKTMTINKFLALKHQNQNYMSNTEILSPDFLNRMNHAAKYGQIWM